MMRAKDLELEPRPIDPLPSVVALLPPAAAVVETEPAPGRYPELAVAGHPFAVRVRAFAPDLDEPLTGVIRWRHAFGPRWHEEPLHSEGDNRFAGTWTPPEVGDYEWTVELWLGEDSQNRPGSSGAESLHLLRAERPDLAAAHWTCVARRPLLDLIENAPADAILLLPPIFALNEDGELGRQDLGHYTIDPALGGAAEFGQLSAALQMRGTALAMTVPLRCSPEHPFRQREPEAFDADGIPDLLRGDWPRRWEAWEAVFRFWLVQGIDLFHIPAPQTAPVSFWEHLIESLRRDFPAVAFSYSPEDAPEMAAHLTGAGFWCKTHPTQSTPEEPAAPVEQTPTKIEPALKAEPISKPPAAQHINCTSSNPNLIPSLSTDPSGGVMLRIVSSEPSQAASAHIHLDGAALDLSEHERYYLRDLADGRAYRWSGTTNFITLEIGEPAKTFRIERT